MSEKDRPFGIEIVREVVEAIDASLARPFPNRPTIPQAREWRALLAQAYDDLQHLDRYRAAREPNRPQEDADGR